MSTALSISTTDGDAILPSDDLTDSLPDEVLASVIDELANRLADIPVDVAAEDRADEALLDDNEPMVYDDEPVPVPATANVVPLAETQAELDAKAKATIRETLRDSFFSDPYIISTAEDLAISDDDLMKWEDRRNSKDQSVHKLLVFTLRAVYFKDWRRRHEVSIGTGFTPHRAAHEYRTDPSSDSSKDGSEDKESTQSRIGHIITRYDCHRRGSPRVFKNRQPGGKSGKTRVRKEKLPCNCPSYFNAIFQPGFHLSNGKVADIYRIEYRLDHNHQLGKDGSVGTLQKSKAMRDRIKSMLMRGMSISTIMTQLTMDHAKFTRLMDCGSNSYGSRFARDDFVTYDDVYNIYYTMTAKQMRKDENPVISARLWMEELDSRGYFTYYDKEQKTNLFTIVVKNRDTGFGVPVAFFLTRLSRWQVLAGWLNALKAKMDELCVDEFVPTAVITDQGQTEINAIQAVRGQLRSILYARTVSDAEALIAAFRASWQEIAPRFMKYIEEFYFQSDSDRRRWMFCHREGVSYAWINTNNYIESWHNALKMHFFKDKSERRIDVVIYILVHRALPHYEQRCIRHQVQVGRMVPTVKGALIAKNAALDHMDLKRTQDQEASFLIPTADPGCFLVESFQGPPTRYEVRVDWKKGLVGHVVSCTCPFFVKMSNCCKHIALATIELPHTEFSHAGHWELQDPSSLEDQPVEDNTPAVVEIAPTMLFTHYMESLNNVLTTMDRERTITNHEEVLSAMAKAVALCQMHVPISAEYSPNRKRQRQR
ncbi:hypothetical protein BGZ99_004324 [Dissophora globulifera]|uniref:SWIM-type domain-containing protein n=1 Tax=Dissophora globulifera TaxID=979702 RepID=A0A9P6RUR1_9FUNG|nr:hypothetical protein BGZ99_004324 [Dissophora globulifera]